MTTPSELFQNKRLSERICLEVRRMSISGVKKFEVIGQEKYIALPHKLMDQCLCAKLYLSCHDHRMVSPRQILYENMAPRSQKRLFLKKQEDA